MQEAARRIAACAREADTVCRLGGDEFVVMLEELSDVAEEAAAQAKAIGEKILAAIDQPCLLEDRECHSTASIGITVFGDRQQSTDEVLQQADIALYQAKAAGRNTMRFFSPALQAAVNARATLEEDLRQAIKDEAVPALLSAAGRARALDRRRGPDPLEASQARPRAARRVHSPGRGIRADPALGRLGAGGGLRADCRLGRAAGNRASVALPSTSAPGSSASRSLSSRCWRRWSAPAPIPKTSSWN